MRGQSKGVKSNECSREVPFNDVIVLLVVGNGLFWREELVYNTLRSNVDAMAIWLKLCCEQLVAFPSQFSTHRTSYLFQFLVFVTM